MSFEGVKGDINQTIEGVKSAPSVAADTAWADVADSLKEITDSLHEVLSEVSHKFIRLHQEKIPEASVLSTQVVGQADIAKSNLERITRSSDNPLVPQLLGSASLFKSTAEDQMERGSAVMAELAELQGPLLQVLEVTRSLEELGGAIVEDEGANTSAVSQYRLVRDAEAYRDSL